MTVWESMAWWHQLEHLIVFVVLLYPCWVTSIWNLAWSTDAFLGWVTDGEHSFGWRPTGLALGFDLDDGLHATTVCIWGFIGVFFSLGAFLELTAPATEPYTLHPLWEVISVLQFVLYPFIIRFAYRHYRIRKHVAENSRPQK